MKAALGGLGTQAGTGYSLESSGHNQGKDPEAGLCSCENEKKSQVSVEGSKDGETGRTQLWEKGRSLLLFSCQPLTSNTMLFKLKRKKRFGSQSEFCTNCFYPLCPSYLKITLC